MIFQKQWKRDGGSMTLLKNNKIISHSTVYLFILVWCVCFKLYQNHLLKKCIRRIRILHHNRYYHRILTVFDSKNECFELLHNICKRLSNFSKLFHVSFSSIDDLYLRLRAHQKIVGKKDCKKVRIEARTLHGAEKLATVRGAIKVTCLIFIQYLCTHII